MKLKKLLVALLLPLAGVTGAGAVNAAAGDASATISLKTPGNPAQEYPLTFRELRPGLYAGTSSADVPLLVSRQVENMDGRQRITLTLTAQQDLYFNYGEELKTGYRHDDCQFYMPGFWYRRNLRSPKEAPSFHTSDSWLVRDDRLSTPLTAAFDEKNGRSVSVIHISDFATDALTTHEEGEVILSGETSVGYTGFLNKGGETVLAYGFPYREEPRTYIRKCTLAPAVKAFQYLPEGESIVLTWEISERQVADFSECVQRTWEYCYDTNRPQPVQTSYTPDYMKEVLSNYFLNAYVPGKLCFYSSPEMVVATCASIDQAEVGFVGRTLLNAFNALEYGEGKGNNPEMVKQAQSIFDSYLANGLSEAGFFHEVARPERGWVDPVHSIRRQSEGVYAVLYYLNYEKSQGRKHPEWEQKVRNMLDKFLQIQNEDGSFPRKFRDDFSLVDASGGSTPSATLPLVMGYKYFKDKRYLESARRTVDYLEREIISKADYFSSTLDANCEDKEASLYAATAIYYLALVSGDKEKERYVALAKKAAYFALSWYYTWDVPFAQGQMLGDLGLKTRGWGNVSVENNHIDVFIFDFADVLHWLARECGEKRFSDFAEVISTSMRQLLPREGYLCGMGKVGYYPEVVQHTHWDYGRNGKGYYNVIFAPGWTVASLWELFSPGRAEQFLQGKK